MGLYVTCRLIFRQFEPAVRERFSRAIDDAGDLAKDIQLKICDDALRPGLKAEFAAFLEKKAVRITWNGIATLWACCQAFARIAMAMDEGVRQGRERIDALPNSVKIGLGLLTASMWLNTKDLPSDGKAHWFDGVPPPSAQPNDQHSCNGNQLFFGALAWILRHEIAHITLGHVSTVANYSIVQEKEADDQAADWLRGDRNADGLRPVGAAPVGEELELERRALAIVLGTVWIASFEIRAREPSTMHPPIADRIFNTLDRMGLREDSAALMTAANCIQALIDPQGQWSTADKPFTNSLEFLQEAVRRLQHYMLDLKHQQPWHAPSPESGHKPE